MKLVCSWLICDVIKVCMNISFWNLLKKEYFKAGRTEKIHGGSKNLNLAKLEISFHMI